MKKAAIYARFSSDLQDARSITDQTALCRNKAATEGWAVAAEYSDAAISGSALHNRPGLLDLIMAAKAKAFEIVICESLDRLSRDLEDIAGLHKRLSFWGIRIVTLADGEVGTMHVGLKGLISQMFLADLAQKTRRGHIGRLNAGRLPGGKLYGYDVVDGAERGLRTINEAEAAVVRRIFQGYAGGISPRKLVRELNAEGVPAPRGGLWNTSTITGSAQRQNGIINSRLYIGEVVYNRERMIKDPATGRRVHQVNPRSEWLVHTLPGLQIVARDVFDAAQAVRATASRQHLTHRRRPKHLLSGVVACGCCGANMVVVRGKRIGCSAYVNKSACENRTTITVDTIERRVLAALRTHLLAPEIIEAAVESYRAERERLARKKAGAARQAMKELQSVEQKISRLVTAIEDGGDARALSARLADLERQRDALADIAPQAASNVLSLHPNAAQRYRQKVEDIQSALNAGDEAGLEAVRLVRELIRRIVVTPASAGGGSGNVQTIEIEGDLAVMVGATPAQSITQARYRLEPAPATTDTAPKVRIPFKLTG